YAAQKKEEQDWDRNSAESRDETQEEDRRGAVRQADGLERLAPVIAAEYGAKSEQELAVRRMHVEHALPRAAVGRDEFAPVHLIKDHLVRVIETDEMGG